MVAIPWTIVLEQAGTALLIIAYLVYELRWGRGAHLMDQMDGIIKVVIAIARENDNIDEERVADRLNGDAPADYQILYQDRDQDTDDRPTTTD